MKDIQTKKEEFWNTFTHAIGLLLALTGIVILYRSARFENENLRLGLILYSISLILLYAASTGYHFVSKKNLKRKLRVVDHISIFFLIAGTYSPMVLTLLKDSYGIYLFYTVWGIAIHGTILKLFFTGRFEKLSLILYLLMGLLIVIDSLAVFNTFSSMEILMLILGGVFYIVGIYFYTKSSMYFNHVIWHIFVLLGSFSHFLMIYFTVAKS